MNGLKTTTDKLKLLDVTLDRSLTFHEHAKEVNTKVLERNNAIKAICSKKKRKEITLYKAMVKSVLNCGAAAWASNLSESNWKKLEARQNDSLGAVTGCLKVSPVDHPRRGTMCMPIKDHCHMITAKSLPKLKKIDYTLNMKPYQKNYQENTSVTR